MNRLEEFQSIETIFNDFQQGLKSNDHSLIFSSLKAINNVEALFLKYYQNKKKEGVYYTNSEISKFMVRETLVLLLNKRFKNLSFNKLEDIYELDPSSKILISDNLAHLKILDPACGSGVFLLSAADILYELIQKLNPTLNPNEIKIQITKNLHGFDINGDAIKLCILKLFKWIIQNSKQGKSHSFSILSSNIKIQNIILAHNDTKYDIIVSNPPYGRYLLSNKEKNILQKQNISYEDIYCVFLSKMIDWSNGFIGFLVPKSFFLRQSYLRFRNIFLSKVNLRKIYDIGPNLFKMATNEVAIIFYQKKDSQKDNLKIYDYPNRETINYSNQNFDALRICYNFNCPLCDHLKKIYVYTFKEQCPFCKAETIKLNRIRIKPTPEIYKLINKIEDVGNLNYLNIKNFPKMVRGEEDKGLKCVKKMVRNNTDGTCTFINAKKDFSYYYIKQNKSFNIEEISDELLKGRNYEYYISPKLLIKHNNTFPEAVYTEDAVCFTSSIYSLLHEDFNELKYLNAVLNSALIYFYCLYGINNQKDTTINLNQYMIRHLPIVTPNNQIKTEIIRNVEQLIYNLKAKDGKIDDQIKKKMKEIDVILYSLYSITAEEQKLIESVSNSI